MWLSTKIWHILTIYPTGTAVKGSNTHTHFSLTPIPAAKEKPRGVLAQLGGRSWGEGGWPSRRPSASDFGRGRQMRQKPFSPLSSSAKLFASQLDRRVNGWVSLFECKFHKKEERARLRSSHTRPMYRAFLKLRRYSACNHCICAQLGSKLHATLLKSLQDRFIEGKYFAPGEARTHGLQIMRLTRCLLRYGGLVTYILVRIYLIWIISFIFQQTWKLNVTTSVSS